MRSPARSFPIHSLALGLLSVVIIVVVAGSRYRLRSNPSWVVGFPPRNREYYYYSYRYYYVGQPRQRRRPHSLLDTTCRPSSPGQLCDHIEMIRRHHQQQQQPFPPPLGPNRGSSDHEIDPRYGVEKRLVPSGPNPLHN